MTPKVTIIVFSFNHGKFIKQAIESILDQKVNFDFHIIVADDGSTDNTSNVLIEIVKENQNKITVLSHELNKGVLKNLLRIIPCIKSDYIAVLDGDDFWDFNLKLQSQVDFLDQNLEFNGYFHDALIKHEGEAESILFDKKKTYSQSYNYKSILSNIDVLERKIILPSSSALLRMSGFKSVNLDLLNDNFSLLWKLSCFFIKESKFYYHNEPWSVYRNHISGISKGSNEKFHLSHIKFLKALLNDRYYRSYSYEIYSTLSNEYKILIESKNNNLTLRRKKFLFRKYFVCELKKNWYYFKKIS
jgi:glycosyltransferase involved in cell wall biosynthesis